MESPQQPKEAPKLESANFVNITEFNKAFNDLILISEKVLVAAITANIAVNKNGEIINLTKLSNDINNYKKCFALTKESAKEELQLGIFKHMLKNNIQILSSLIDNNDDWIKNKDIKLHYGINLGKPVKIILNISDIYDISIKIKENHEKNISQFPEVFKENETTKYPDILVYLMIKIFTLCSDEEYLKKFLNLQERKLGIGQRSQRTKMPDISAIADVGIDMFAKFQENTPGAQKMDTKVMKKAVSEAFSGGAIQQLMTNLQNMNNKPGEAPDIGMIFSSLFQNFNPESLMQTMKPIIDNVNASNAENKTKEEVSEEIEETEEIKIIEEEI